MKPNKDCPNCQGVGISERVWDCDIRAYVVPTDPTACAICHADFDAVHTYTEKFIMDFSGKASLNMPVAEQNESFTGIDGQKYRRLVQWLWTHPPASGQDKNGFPVGYKSKPSASFRKLFSFERTPHKPRIPKAEFPSLSVRPWFCATVADLKEAWTFVNKGTDGSKSKLPILRCVLVSTDLYRVQLEADDLETRTAEHCPADIYTAASAALPGKLMLDLLRTCDKKGVISFGFHMNAPDYGRVIVGHKDAVWEVLTLPAENFPSKRIANNYRESEAA
jgi:hypothetical protein